MHTQRCFFSVLLLLLVFTAPAQRAQAQQVPFTYNAAISSVLSNVDRSSVAWGDYDNDGDLDILLSGRNNQNRLVSEVYTQGAAGSFTKTSILPGISDGTVAWGDYDNDGDLDILLTGYGGSSGSYLSQVWDNDGQGGFTKNTAISNRLSDVNNSAAVWGDYDNDGDLDILLSGDNFGSTLVSQVYDNNGQGGFTRNNTISTVLSGAVYSAVAWGDYDNDGDLDILLTGSTASGLASQVYDNDGQGGFTKNTDISNVLSGVAYGAVAWGDYDNDGDLDILLTGDGRPYVSEVYDNDGQGGFTKNANITLPGVSDGAVAWGDYDNDGDLDILLTGCTNNICSSRLSEVYDNDGQGGFTKNTDISNVLPGVGRSSVAWGDYDNDGDLDILLAGSGTSQVYENTGAFTPNAPPAAPANLNTSNLTPDTATLSWDAPTDDTTPQKGLSYNLRVGTTPGGQDVLAPMSLFGGPIDGQRTLVARAPVQPDAGGSTASWTIKGLEPGQTYYWSVQAVDQGFAGSAFAAEGPFTIPAPDLVVSVSESVDPVAAGSGAGNLVYTVTVTNSGSADASGVALENTLTLPSGVTLDMVTPSTGSFVDPIWTVGDLAAGASEMLTVTLTVDASAAEGTDVISNTASVTAINETDTDASNDSASAATSIVHEVDLSVAVSESADPITAGSGAGNLVYIVTVTNDGPSDATGVVLDNTLALPSGVTVDTATSSVGTFSDPTWTLGDLAAGASETLTVTLTVDASAAEGTDVISNTASVTAINETDTDASNDSASAATSITRMVDLVVAVSESADPVMAGSGVGNLTYIATVTNDGPSDATGVVLDNTLALPSGVTVDTATSSMGTFSDPTWTLGGLAAGASATLTIVVTVEGTAAAGTDVISNTATLTALNETDTDASNDSASVATSVTAGNTDLALIFTADRATALPGETITYTASVTNSGPGHASGVVITQTAPAGLTLVATAGCQEDPSGLPTCLLGTIASDASAQATFTFTVDSPVAAGLEILSSTAAVTSATPDPDGSNNEATQEIPVEAVPELSLTKDDGAVNAMPGEEIVYTLTYTNTGDQDASGIVLTETVPVGTTFDADAGTDGWSCADGAGAATTCSFTVGQHVAGLGGSGAVHFAVTLDNPLAAGLNAIINTASVADDGSGGAEANPANNTATATTPVAATIAIEATLADTLLLDGLNQNLADPGDVLEYTALIANTGNQGVASVVFTDTVDVHTALDCSSVRLSQGTLAACIDGPGGHFIADLTTIDGVPGAVLAAQAEVEITFAASIMVPFPDDVSEVATQGYLTYVDQNGLVQRLTDDPETVVAEDSTITEVMHSADLALALLAKQEKSEVPVFITVTNHGPVAAKATIPVDLPTGVTVVSYEGDGTYKPNKKKWKTGLIAVGDSVVLALTLRQDPVAAVSWTVLIGSASQPDLVEDNNTATVMLGEAAKARQEQARASLEAVSEELPLEFALSPNYPNPFNPETTIPFALPEASEVTVAVYDMTGRRVAMLVQGRLQAGRHEVHFQADRLASGLYLVRMQAGSFSQVRRMTLVK